MRYIIVVFSLILSTISLHAGIQITYKLSIAKNNPLVDTNEIIPDKVILSIDENYARVERSYYEGQFRNIDYYNLNNQKFFVNEKISSNPKTENNLIMQYNPYIDSSIRPYGQLSGTFTIPLPLPKLEYNIQHLDDTTHLSILGYPCKRAIGEWNNLKIEILYTDVMKHQFFQYGDLKGLALVFKMEDKIFDEILYTATSIEKVFFEKNELKPPKIRNDFKSFYTDNKLINTTAKAVKVRKLDNEKVLLNFKQNKIVVLNLLSITCLPCQKEIEYLNRLRQRYIDDDRVQFISIAKERPKYLQYYFKKLPFEYEKYGSGHRAIHYFDALDFPTNLVIDPNGKVVFHKVFHYSTIAVQLDDQIKKLIELHFE